MNIVCAAYEQYSARWDLSMPEVSPLHQRNCLVYQVEGLLAAIDGHV
jgi:hypothetical protein